MSQSLFFLSLFLSLSLFSCGEKKSEILHRDIMTIHDDIMPKTGEMSYLYLAFRKRLDSDSSLTVAQRSELSQQADELEKTEDEMMVWMNDYMPPQKLAATKNEKEIEIYLNSQKTIISNIKTHTETNLEKAKILQKQLSISN